nr:NigD-like protein [uncultured Bacteroides sp.]
MKKFKITLNAFLLLFITMPLLQSCLDDWDDSERSSLTVGTVRIIEGKDYYFSLDDGSKMYPGDTLYVNNYTLVEGQRAFVYFNLLDEKIDGYDYNAKINHIENILTKDIYSMPAEKADSIGDDRINATNLWITGNYLNIQYQLYHSDNPDKKHMLNLVINEASDGKNDKEGYITLEFRQNAYNDEHRLLGTGLVSFKLDKIADRLKNKKGLNIRVKTLYDGERYITVDLNNEEK